VIDLEKGDKISENFRGLLYAPSYENEVVLIFGMLLPYLDDNLMIEEFSGAFPDCIAKRNGKEIGIEFEVNSSDFFTHRHDVSPGISKCDMIVCWKNNRSEKKVKIEDQEIEVLELSEIVKRKELPEFIQNPNKSKYPGKVIWDEASFFNQLRKIPDKERISRIAELYGLFRTHPEFEIVFGLGKK